MPRGPMSPEARQEISAAAKKRWAAHRAAKGQAGGVSKLWRGRPPKQAASNGHNKVMDMTVSALVETKRAIDEAWQATMRMFHGSDKPKRRRRSKRKSN